jgi:multisubunit Na+/H+ antiporter MnhF subunit
MSILLSLIPFTIFLALLSVVSLFLYRIYKGIRVDDDAVIISISATIIMLIIPTISYYNQIEDLIVIDNTPTLLAIHEEQLRSVNKQLEEISLIGTTLANADTPYASMIQAKLDLNEEIVKVKKLKNMSEMNIVSRANSIFWWIPMIKTELD